MSELAADSMVGEWWREDLYSGYFPPLVAGWAISLDARQKKESVPKATSAVPEYNVGYKMALNPGLLG